jgi:large subunit ribosomal protein L18
MAKKSRAEMRKRRHRRVRTQVLGTPERPRLCVFRSLNQIYAQVINDRLGETIVSSSTLDEAIRTKAEKLNKTEQAKLVGKQLAERAKKAGVQQVVFDRGGYKYHGRVKALAESAREAGLEF